MMAVGLLATQVRPPVAACSEPEGAEEGVLQVVPVTPVYAYEDSGTANFLPAEA